MATRIQVRRDTAANWSTVNPVLAEGEIGCNLTTTQIKVGNGTDAWDDLPYTAGDGSLWTESSGVVAPVSAGAKVQANAATVAGDDALTLVTKGYLESLDVTVSDAAPSGAVQGQLWWNTDVGRMFIYYVDGDSTEQWVETTPSQNFLYWERTGTAVHPATDTDSVFVGDNGDGTAAIELNADGTSQFTGDMTFVDNTNTATVVVSAQSGNITLADGVLVSGDFEFPGNIDVTGQITVDNGISITGGTASNIDSGFVGDTNTEIAVVLEGDKAARFISDSSSGVKTLYMGEESSSINAIGLYPNTDGSFRELGGIVVRQSALGSNNARGDITLTNNDADTQVGVLNGFYGPNSTEAYPSDSRAAMLLEFGHAFNGLINQRGTILGHRLDGLPGVAARSMKAGAVYEIIDNGSSGTPTNFTLFGAADNEVGTQFTCTTDADSSSANDGRVQFVSNDSGNLPTQIVFHTNPDRSEFTTGTRGSTKRLAIRQDGTLELTNSPGIYFGAIQGAPEAGAITTSEILDAYEEGTFDPIHSSLASELTGAYVSNARYTRIGNMCTVDIRLQWTSNTASTSTFRLALPFDVLMGTGSGSNTTIGNGGCVFYSGTELRSGNPLVSHAGGGNTINIYEQNATGFNELTIADFTGGAYDLMISLSYFVDD